MRAEAIVDLSAITDNVALLKGRTSAEVMTVVKADGYGHGMVPAARAALAGGATWLGAATPDEALALRAAGIEAPVLTWLWTPAESGAVAAAILAGVDVSVSSGWQLDVVRSVAISEAVTARVHLKIDTGLSRNGAVASEWPDLVAAAAKAAAAGEIEAVGIWSHFACADEPGHPSIQHQLDAFDSALSVAARAGVEPQYRHIANSAATLNLPSSHFDLVRPGIASYGLSPLTDQYGLRPAMTLRAEVANVKRVAAGTGVSYGHRYVTAADTTLVLVPLGYADGIPRAATNRAPVAVNGGRFTIAGTVCMDQFVLDVGDLPVAPGDLAVLFGPGSDGEPTVQEWADALDTIHYELITRIGPRVERVYV